MSDRRQKREVPTWWAIVLRLQEDAIPTNTGHYDESMAFDLPWTQWFNAVLRALKDCRRDEQPLWPFSTAELTLWIHRACDALRLDALAVELYSFRHGGAQKIRQKRAHFRDSASGALINFSPFKIGSRVLAATSSTIFNTRWFRTFRHLYKTSCCFQCTSRSAKELIEK